MRLFFALSALMISSPALASEDCTNDLEQDLNCNFIDVSDELAVDLDDATCAANLDGDGDPYPNADYYYDYTSFGCDYPVVSTM